MAKRIQGRVGITAIRGVDTNPGRREEVASSIDGVEVFADLAQAVEGAEIVVVCTPTASHIDLCNAICELADPHIFIEKPLSHTLEGCDELIFNRARAGKQVAVGYFLRYHPMINKLKAIVDNGELGRVLMARRNRVLSSQMAPVGRLPRLLHVLENRRRRCAARYKS